jgi:hypothetical protein
MESFRPIGGEVLFFAPPKKSTQKKGGPEGLPGKSSVMTFRVPSASRRFGRSPNSQDLPRLPASKSSSTRRLARSQTACDARRRLTGLDADTSGPVARAEYRSQAGMKARTLSEASRSGMSIPLRLRVVRAPGLARNAGHRRQPARASGALLFGYFLLGTQEKVPRPTGRKVRQQIVIEPN